MDCPDLPLVEDGGFISRLKARMAAQRLPLTGSLEVTFRCNLRCVHCYLGDMRSGLPGQQELSLAEIRGLLDQVADAGVLYFLLTGGEPFVRPDMLGIYDYARKKGLLVYIFSNGTLLSPHIADHLAEMPPFGMEITLYGATQETYEKITGIPGSFERCLRSIDLLLERGTPFKLKTMLMTLNKNELTAMQQFSLSRGVEFRFDSFLNGAHDGSSNMVQYRISPEQAVEAELEDPVRSSEKAEFLRRFSGKSINRQYLYTCGAGLNSFHIDPYGKLSPCISSRARTYDLRQGTFKDGWDQFLPRERDQLTTRDTKCTTCGLRSICEQCVGRAYTESGDPEEPVEYLCRLAHLRARAYEL